jgi:hypothetical protein
VIKGIKSIKCRVQEAIYTQRIDSTREQELNAFKKYCNIKNICNAIYVNAGILISALVFLIVDKKMLDLGKVFSTLALLNHIFNFSIMYSNSAIEQLFNLKVLMRRIDEIITQPYDESLNDKEIKPLQASDSKLLAFKNATISWNPVKAGADNE